MAKIISIAPNGNWNGMYKFQVVLDNGMSGTAYSKQPTLRFNIGDEVVGTLNEKGSLKLDAPGYAGGQQQYQQPQSNNYSNQAAPAGMSKDELIVRQVALKAGVELGAAQGLDLNQILQHANVFNEWIMRKETGRTHQEHFTQDEDPFLS